MLKKWVPHEILEENSRGNRSDTERRHRTASEAKKGEMASAVLQQ
jgi:hypothetical protein